jgi:Ni,Fe-hydrogenase I cytochrome b subunit
MWVIIGYIVVHVTGVILAELGKNKGIVSGMINGKDSGNS